MPDISVFLADDHPMILAGIRAMLEAEHGIEVVGEATDGRNALAWATALKPQVAVLDMSMPGLNGIEVVSGLAKSCPDCRCIALTVHDDRVYVRRMLEAGVRGYLLKRSAPGELVRAIRAVMQGGVYLDPAIAMHAIERAEPHHADGTAPANDLTPREAAVLQLTVKGHSNKAVAGLLGISARTVESHKANAMEKLGFSNKVELLRYAAEQGWLATP